MINFVVYIKMVNKYYQKHQETFWKKAHVRYQNFSEEEKVKRRKKAWERYWHFTKKKEEQRHQYYLEQENKLPSIEEIIIQYMKNNY